MKHDWSDLPMQRRMVLGFSSLLEAATYASSTFNSSILSRHPLFLELPSTGSTPIVHLFHNMKDYLSAISWHLMHQHQPEMLRVTLVNDNEHEPAKHRAYFEVTIGHDVMIFCEATDYTGEGGKNKATLDGLFTVLCDTYQVGIDSNTRSFEHGESADEFIITEQACTRT